MSTIDRLRQALGMRFIAVGSALVADGPGGQSQATAWRPFSTSAGTWRTPASPGGRRPRATESAYLPGASVPTPSSPSLSLAAPLVAERMVSNGVWPSRTW